MTDRVALVALLVTRGAALLASGIVAYAGRWAASARGKTWSSILAEERCMTYVSPRQAAEIIDGMFSNVVRNPHDVPGFGVDQVPALRALVALIEAVPRDLIVVSPEQYAAFTASVAAIQGAAEIYQTSRVPTGMPFILRGFDRSPIAIVHATLAACPDAVADPSTSALTFISDASLAESLRLDLSAAHTALGRGEWKAATVLAGALVEALLLWAVNRHSDSNRAAAIQAALTSEVLKQKPRPAVEDWQLGDFIEVSGELACIRNGTRDEARRTKDYRNLIHPGAAIRTQTTCDHGTALVAVGTAEHVVRDLAAKGAMGACP